VALHDDEDFTLIQIPELYYVPYDKVCGLVCVLCVCVCVHACVWCMCDRIRLDFPPLQTDMEYQRPHSQERCPGHKRQTTWAQSLFILGELLFDVSVVSAKH